MSLILAIETSTTSGSVALSQEGNVIGSQQYNLDKSHSSLIHVMIQQLMENTGFELKDLDAVAIAEGPGSYTGLRIGTSATKGLCFSLDIPLISVNTLVGMAYQVYRYNKQVDLYCPMIDARRLEVYTLLMDADFKVIKETEPLILDETSFEKELTSNKILFFGDGSEKFKSVVKSENAIFIDGVFPSAEDIAILAHDKFVKSNFENLVTFEPFYLKEFRIIPPKK